MAYDPLDSFIFLTNRVGRLLSNAVRRQCSDERIAQIFPHMGVLVDLWSADGIAQQDLAVSLIKDKGTIARSLDVLERNDMVERKPDPNDRRMNRIYLTQSGKDLQRELQQVASDVLEQSVVGIPPDQLRQCLLVLQNMYLNLNRNVGASDGSSGTPRCINHQS